MQKFSALSLALLLALLAGCAAQPAPAQPAPEPVSVPAAEPSGAPEPAPAEAETPAPVYAHQIKEGTYPIDILSSSSMFRVVDAQLTVENGAMTCLLTMSSKSYGRLYLGTGEAALADDGENAIPAVVVDGVASTFVVPVEALNTDIDCAAWSIRKEMWYDRVLVFQSGRIPPEAIALP